MTSVIARQHKNAQAPESMNSLLNSVPPIKDESEYDNAVVYADMKNMHNVMTESLSIMNKFLAVLSADTAVRSTLTDRIVTSAGSSSQRKGTTQSVVESGIQRPPDIAVANGKASEAGSILQATKGSPKTSNVIRAMISSMENSSVTTEPSEGTPSNTSVKKPPKAKIPSAHRTPSAAVSLSSTSSTPVVNKDSTTKRSIPKPQRLQYNVPAAPVSASKSSEAIPGSKFKSLLKSLTPINKVP